MSIGENFMLLNKNTRDYVWKVAMGNTDFAKGLALALSKKYYSLDKEIKEKVKELAERSPAFAEAFRSENTGQINSFNPAST